MTSVFFPFIIGFGLSIITVLADSFIKNASLQNGFSGWKMLVFGACIYGFTGFGWFFVMRKMKLSTLGVLYGVSCVLLLTLVSVFYYKEKINLLEIVGIGMAVGSLILLSRFG
jgi:small multidrug resistance pump